MYITTSFTLQNYKKIITYERDITLNVSHIFDHYPNLIVDTVHNSAGFISDPPGAG